MLNDATKAKVLSQATSKLPPDFELIKAVLSQATPLAIAMLAIVTYCNTQPTAKAFNKALKLAGFPNPQIIINDMDQLQPLFEAAVVGFREFRKRVEMKGRL